jgi:hypothetical protein
VSDPDNIPAVDLPLAMPGASDSVVGEQLGKLRRFKRDSFPLRAADEARLRAAESAVSSNMRGYATKAALDADLTPADGILALVTNDGVAANNGTWRKAGASGAGSWTQAVDRVSSVESRAAAIEAGAFNSLGFQFTALAPESGYAWGIVDSAMRAALLVGLDGSVVIPKFDLVIGAGEVTRANLAAAVQDVLATELATDSGYVWAVVDSQDRLGFGIKSDGTLVGKFPAVVPAGSEYLQPNRNIWCLGDSLTAGAGGQTTWRQQLATQYPDRSITNWAVGGQTSTQIAARAGAYVSLLTVSGNQIPASGAVAVTARTVSLITSQGNQSLLGWLGGIYGTLTRASDDSYSFTRSAAGSATYCAPKSPFVPDVAGHDLDTLIVFLGRNNLSEVDNIKRDIARCVALQKTAEKRFLIITPPNGGTLTSGASTTEGTGSATLANIKAIEDWTVQEYGDRVLKVREYSFQFNNGSADDLDDVAKETVPRSLRIDSVHWTTALHGYVADWVENEITRRGW